MIDSDFLAHDLKADATFTPGKFCFMRTLLQPNQLVKFSSSGTVSTLSLMVTCMPKDRHAKGRACQTKGMLKGAHAKSWTC